MLSERGKMIQFYNQLTSDYELMEEVEACIEEQDYQKFLQITKGFRKENKSWLDNIIIFEDDGLL